VTREAVTFLYVTGIYRQLGKTSLVAAFVKQFSTNYYDWFVIPHFVGAAPGSTSIRDTIIRYCKELSQKYHLEHDIPESFHELKELFFTVLKESAGTCFVFYF
jgi:hypothetical protein